jgi:hypothetical protein
MPLAAILIFGVVLVLLALWSLAPPASLHWRWWHAANAAAETGLMTLVAVGLTLWLWSEDRPHAAEWAALSTLVVVLIDLWRIGLPLVTLDGAETHIAISLQSQQWLLGAAISSVAWLGLLVHSSIRFVQERRTLN